MSLVVWLPFNYDINNQGTGGGTFTGSPSYVSKKGKITNYCLSGGNITMPSSVTSKAFNKDTVSVAFWLYNGGSTGCIFGTEGMTHPNNRRFTLFQYPNAVDLHWSWQNSDSDTTFTSGVASGVLTSNAWSHICAVWDNGTARIYVNGVQVGTSTGTCTTTNWSYDTIIARASSTRYYNDLRIYNHALSVKEVKELAKGLALHYKFNFEDLYVPVEYIQGTGTQQIDTGLKFDMTNDYCEVDFASTTTSQNGMIFASNSGTNNHFWFYHYKDGTGIHLYIKNAGSQIDLGKIAIDTSRHKMQWKNKQYIMDGSVIGTDSRSLGVTDYNIYLFSWGGNYYYKGRIYGCKIWKSGTLTRNFIPCIRKCDSKPGLFDLVTYNFYTNSGSGEFSYPSVSLSKKIPDISGYKFNGTITNNYITYPCTLGNSCMVLLNGNNCYINTTQRFYNLFSGGQTPFSISFWVYNYETSSGNDRGTIFGNYYNSNSGAWNVEVNGGSTNKALRLYWQGSPDFTASNCILDYEVWVNVGIVYNGSSIKVYKNGNLVDTYSGTLSTMTPSQIFFIGNDQRSGGLYFAGSIGDFRLYATALSDADIMEIYKTSESIDNKGNIYCNTINELGSSMSFKKNGVIECNSIVEGFSKTSVQGAYTQLEYIKTNGNQIINTGVADTLRTTVDLDMQVDEGRGQYWYGSTQNSSSMMYNGLYNLTALEYNWLTISRTSNNRCIMTQRLNGNSITITMNGVTSKVSVGSTAPTGNLYIFGCNNGSRYYGTGILCRYFRIYQDNILIRDFIPVKRNSDSAIGMLDLVNNVFYANSGTGSFTAGNEINKKYSIYTNNIIIN